MILFRALSYRIGRHFNCVGVEDVGVVWLAEEGLSSCVSSFLTLFSSASFAFIMESLRRAFSPFSKGRSSRRDNEEPMLSEDRDYEGSTEPTATPYNAVEMVSQHFTVFTRIATVY